jgi:hypothetical protein
MRKPCPLYLDLISLILESDFNKQRVLHFGWFRHAGTRVRRLKKPSATQVARTAPPGERSAGAPPSILRGDDDLAELRADAARERPAREASDPPQMVLFPADVSRAA